MTNFLWGTWRRRDLTLLVTSVALFVVSLATGAHWLSFAADIAFAGAMFCWGASYLESQYEDCGCEEVEA